jgi:peptide-methionine (R)-S-oxide reductase
MDKEELKQKIGEEAYRITQEKGTEVPFTGEYVNHHEGGTYNCVVCSNPLFSSDAKFDSGTGWPSFDDAIPNSTKSIPDDSLGMARTEIVCAKCGAHLGHKFEDGPKDTTGNRFCINSACLLFDKK